MNTHVTPRRLANAVPIVNSKEDTLEAKGASRRPKPRPAAPPEYLNDLGASWTDWRIDTVARKFRACEHDPNVPITLLAGYFHHVRLSMGEVSIPHQQAAYAAQALYPEQPEGVRPIGTTHVPGKIYFPDGSWPAWRKRLHEHWTEQCRAIDRGMDIPALRQAVQAAEALKEDIVAKILVASVNTIKDARDKLGVLLWHFDDDDSDGPVTERPFWKFAKDLDALVARKGD